MEGSKSAPRIEQPIPQLSLPVRRWRWREVVSRLEAAATSPWFAYGTISVLQAKLIWGIWLYRDFPNGDTAYYFRGASQWAHGLHISSVYSPLYQIYYGAFEWFLSGPYAVTIVHRIILVFAVSLLVVAVLRRLLP